MKAWDENLQNDAVYFTSSDRLENLLQTLQIMTRIAVGRAAFPVPMAIIRRKSLQENLERLQGQKRKRTFQTFNGIMPKYMCHSTVFIARKTD
jgi:hypothetical protein